MAISIGAVAGANFRYLVGGWISDRFGAEFPFGTLFINATGSLVMGFVITLVTVRVLAPWWVRPMVAIGFLGAYTTFSTFSYETLALIRAGSLLLAGLNVLASVGLALLGVYLGTVVAQAA
ncbi:MAG TPA: fluoride efflux transporter CrcB [Candidatus Saccharimonadales bacterium]|nr:fluoride efflux transporter CrcB [Candidatus Saccharimonadales bacterium]